VHLRVAIDELLQAPAGVIDERVLPADFLGRVVVPERHVVDLRRQRDAVAPGGESPIWPSSPTAP
jgi:hypothetical protein